MSLPPGFLDELRNRVPISSVVGRKVTWDMRKSNQAKGDFWAPCPFHQEKSASFHVDDKKGFYYCFGCHAKGDTLKFLQETENMGFMEAVEMLAREAGMTMPARDPRAAEKADHLGELAAVMDAAARFFRMQLNSGAAAHARDYLQERGLQETALERFEIGFAPPARRALMAYLTGAGIAPARIIEAGLAIAPDDGSAPFDRFRNRIIFPIRDARGRCIAFGGRAMDPNDRAKYLNSPETPLFDKGRSLYNVAAARAAAGKHGPLIVAEGYMDVIALVMAGFEAAVAPLGTAITEEQLRMIWRLSPEPVIALDGDTAGLRAGHRLMDLALPLLSAEQSLRFCLLPEKMDPDDVLRTGGAGAMRKLADEAVPLVQLLWQRETEGQNFETPEQRVSLERRLEGACNTIADQRVRSQYNKQIGARIRDLFWKLDSAGRGKSRRSRETLKPSAGSKKSRIAIGTSNSDAEHLTEELVVALLAVHPDLTLNFEATLERLRFSSPIAEPVRGRLLLGQLSESSVESLLALPHVSTSPLIKLRDKEKIASCVNDWLNVLLAKRGLATELREATEDVAHLSDEGLTWRLRQASETRNRAERSRLSDSADLGEDRAAMSGALQRMIESEVWVKRKK